MSQTTRGNATIHELIGTNNDPDSIRIGSGSSSPGKVYVKNYLTRNLKKKYSHRNIKTTTALKVNV